MSVVSDRRVPGVYFLPPPVRRGLGLPPLDVAAFVGFAEKGPVDLPVPIGDVNTYREIFGGDLALAREDGERTVYANLPQSVAAFFANGGRRCYVVRVAGVGATNTRCRLPGLVALGRDGIQLASIRASSPGRWSAGFRLATRLDRVPLPLDAFTHAPETPRTLRWDARAAPAAIQTGDLLRLTFVDEAGNRQQVLVPVSSVTRGADAAEQVTLSTSQIYSVVPPAAIQPSWTVADSRRLTTDASADDVFVFDLRIDDDAILLTADMDDEKALGEGDVLLLTISLDPAHAGTFLFPVTGVRQAGGNSSPPDSSPPEGSVELRATTMLRLDADQTVTGTLAGVERLRFELALRDGDQRRATIGDLAFNAGHPTYWGEVALLDSSPLRPRPAVVGANVVQSVLETPEAEAARIYNLLQTDQRIDPVRDGVPSPAMLAGLLAPVSGDGLLFLPLDMPGVLTDDRFVAPSTSDVGRDGLDRFDGGSFNWFVDERLTLTPSDPSLRTAELMGNAFDIQYVQNKRLRGLHSLLWIDEVALISVPEAVQRNWSPAAPPPGDVVLPAREPAAPEPCPPSGPFLYCIRPPEIAEIEPATGPLRGGTQVVVRGEGFDPLGATTVSFDGVPASDVVVLSGIELHCTTPTAGVARPVVVDVTTSAGTGTLPSGFRYLPETVEPVLPELAPIGDYDIDAATSPLLPLQRELLRCCVARG
ncbi:MAG TPA: IPT/TIG domain-containing protein, partial [Thermomicrobiales bacterium]|nr:IPT/TIG domain-containing protein [Thermomicrobiales bacterium]